MPATQSGPSGPGPSTVREPSGQTVKKDPRFVRRALSPGHLVDPRRLSTTSGQIAAATALTTSRPATVRARDKFVPLPDANRQSQVVVEEAEEELAAELLDSTLTPPVAETRGRITVITVAESFNRKALEAALQQVAATAATHGSASGAGPPPLLPAPPSASPAVTIPTHPVVPTTPTASVGGSLLVAATDNSITAAANGAAAAAAAEAAAATVGAGTQGPVAGLAPSVPGSGPPSTGAGGGGGTGTGMAGVGSGGPGRSKPAPMAVTAYPEVTYIRTAHGEAMDTPGEVFFFDYGVVAFWGMTEAQEQALLSAVVRRQPGVAVEPLDEDEKKVEELLFVYSDAKPNIRNDVFTVDRRLAGDHQVKMAISHALAQSSKLAVYEERMMGLVEEVRHIPAQMAETGAISLSRRQVAKLMGKVFLLKAAVNLTATMLGTPEFFWRARDQLQAMYEVAFEYLDIQTRLDMLNARFMVIQRMLSIWSDHSAHQNLARLDVIIVLLILLEVVMAGMEVVGFFLRRRGWEAPGPRLGLRLLGRLFGLADPWSHGAPAML